MALVRLSAMVLLVPLLSLAAVPLFAATSVATLVARVISAVIGVTARFVLPGRMLRRARSRPGREEDDDEEVGRFALIGYSGVISMSGEKTMPWAA